MTLGERDDILIMKARYKFERDELQTERDQLMAERKELKFEKDEVHAKMNDEQQHVLIMGEKLPRIFPDNLVGLDSTMDALTRLLQKKSKIRKKMNTYPVCLDNRKDTFMNPCGHQGCRICVERVNRCPICRMNINGRTRMYG